MRSAILVLLAGVLLLASAGRIGPPALAQEADDSLIKNPDLTLPPGRVNPNVQYSLREARAREQEAIQLDGEGKKDLALDKWRDAMARYEALRREHLDPEMPVNSELLVRAEWVGGDMVHSETWQPLADYINSRYRIADWPRPLRDQLALRQEAPGADLLRRALASGDEKLLRRCARFYQFSESGRRALRLMAEIALERADAVLAVRWLEELQDSWPDHYRRDPMLQVLYVRACRDAGMNYRLGRELRRRETEGSRGEVDVGGTMLPAQQVVEALTTADAPQERKDLKPNGWLTLQGADSRNGFAPRVTGIGEMVDLDGAEGVQGVKIADNVPGVEEQRQNDPYSRRQERKPVPVTYPAVHEAGFFIHKIDETGGQDEKLLWFRHGRETSPVMLEVPAAERYRRRAENNQGGGWFYYNQTAERDRFRVLGSTVARVRWELDQRESDLLFAVMGAGNPSREKGSEATGNQIQVWNVSDDCSLRVTLPNRKVESESDLAFLKHVVFRGAPLVRDNRLYVAGAVTEKDSIEFWLFCFDVTPKGDAAAGEGKLAWRVHLCSKRQEGSMYYRNPDTTVPEISSPSEQGGMVYVSTHAGANAAVDRVTGELCWVSKYGRVGSITGGWFGNPPIVAGGMLVAAPYDYTLALVLDAVWGTMWLGYPLYGKGPREDFEHVLGVVDNRMIIQGRTRIYSVGLTDFRKGGVFQADVGKLMYQSADFGKKEPVGRGTIAGDRVLVPLENEILFFDLHNGKLLTRAPLAGAVLEKAVPFTLTVYCRGESYKDEQGLVRYHPVTVRDPDTGNVYNVEHLPNGAEFTFSSGKKAVVKKETFVLLASARWTYLFKALDS